MTQEHILFDRPDAIIVSHPRSGTHFLQSLLTSHPLINGRGECFLKFKQLVDGKQLVDHNALDVSFLNKRDFFNVAILMYAECGFAHSLFPYFEGISIVHLIRDPLSVAHSVHQKDANRRYYGDSYLSHYRVSNTIPPNIAYDSNLALSFSDIIRKRQDHFSQLLKENRSMLTVRYEDLTNDMQTDHLCDGPRKAILSFFGLNDHPLSTTLRKTGVIHH